MDSKLRKINGQKDRKYRNIDRLIENHNVQWSNPENIHSQICEIPCHSKRKTSSNLPSIYLMRHISIGWVVFAFTGILEVYQHDKSFVL